MEPTISIEDGKVVETTQTKKEYFYEDLVSQKSQCEQKISAYQSEIQKEQALLAKLNVLISAAVNGGIVQENVESSTE